MSNHNTFTPTILDVRALSATSDSETSVLEQVRAGLSKPPGERHLPTTLLYDERGLRLYDELTAHCTAYYPFAEEERILKKHSGDVVRLMGLESGGPGVVVELGAGALRKTSLLLRAMAGLAPASLPGASAPFTYYALDLEHSELDRSLRLLMTTYRTDLEGRVDARGLWGTYEGGIQFIRQGGLVHHDAAVIDADVCEALADPDAKDEDDELPPRGRRALRSNLLGLSLTPEVSCARSATPALSVSSSLPSRSSPDTPSLSPRPLHLEHDGPAHPPLHLLFLGSSLGNLTRTAAPAFLASLPLRPGSGDTLLLGLDGRNEKARVEAAYSPDDRWTRAFIMNGLRNLGRELDQGSWGEEAWEYVGRYDEVEGRHEAYYRSRATETQEIALLPTLASHQDALRVTVEPGEEINIEYSYKYSDADVAELFTQSNLRVIASFASSTLNKSTLQPLYTLHLLERPAFHFPLLSSLSLPPNTHAFHPESAPAEHTVLGRTRRPTGGVPTIEEWYELWKAWDAVTVGMIPEALMHHRPIDLRHKCLFYLGHIPAFLDIHLARMFDEPHTEPAYFKDIFERGIDPNVDDPSQCHDHSIVPEKDEDWPTLDEVLAFRDRVRERVTRVYEEMDNGEKQLTKRVGRVLSMVFEHEIMHAETLLYMLIQVAGGATGSLPPPGFSIPSFSDLARAWSASPPPSSPVPTYNVASGTIKLGHDDAEDDDLSPSPSSDDWKENHEFGWDNESPVRDVEVGSVRVEVRPITNGEYRAWWSTEVGREMPKSWVEIDGQVHVRTLYGPIPFAYAEHWPTQASYDDLSAFARAKGGRLPSEPELRTFLDLTDAGAMANVGFKNWHAVPPYWDAKAQRGHNGGVWEWTSTTMTPYEGYVPSKIYPGYSNDFNDNQHYVVLGGSYATHPRIAQRRTFRNFWQHNYPYAWVGARVAYDN